MVFSCEKFRPYILGSHVVIHTDHVAIKYLMEKKECKAKIDVEYTKEQQLYRILVPSGHIFLTFCIRIGTFDRSRVSGLVQVFRVSCIIVTSVRV